MKEKEASEIKQSPRKIYSKNYSPMNTFGWESVLKRADAYLEPYQTSKIEYFAKIVNDNYFRKTLDLKCLT